MHKEHFCDKRNVLVVLLQKTEKCSTIVLVSYCLVCGTNPYKNVLNSFDVSTVVTALYHGCQK